MSLPHGLLGLLRYQDRTGYELTKVFATSLKLFWHAQESQVYRELKRLEEKGLVVSKDVIQHGKPNKRVYAITQDGRIEFVEWFTTSFAVNKNRHIPLLLHTFFGATSPELTLQRLKELRQSMPTAIEEQMPMHEAAIENLKSSTPSGDRESVFWRMTSLYGKLEAEAIIKWADECIEILENLEGENDVQTN